jgi:methionyl-tRNA formyltransferase
MRLVMMGTGTFAEPTFRGILQAFPGQVVGLITQPERDTGNKRGSTRQTGEGMPAIAQSANIPVLQPPSINSPEGLEALQRLQPELLVVAAYGQILSKEVIATPTVGAINVHASLLPKYRGASPVAHAIWNGESSTGVTIIRISLGLDAGEMLAQESLAIGPDETYGELEARLAPLGARLCVEVVNKLQHGPISGSKQDPKAVTKAPKMTKEHGLVNWSKSAAQVKCQVRAMQPWPTAYTFFHRSGKEPMRLILSRVEVGTSHDAEPGTIFGDANNLHVACGAGTSLTILELQPAGKKKMSSVEFLRGYPHQVGNRFGAESLL